MTKAELVKYLEKFDDNAEILYVQYSDYRILEEKDIDLFRAVPKRLYVMRSHPTMSEENKAKEKDFIVFPGN